MVDMLHLAMVVLLVKVHGTDSLIMGNTSIKSHVACGGCEAEEITCPPTQKVLILQAEHAFKLLSSCMGCDRACCGVQDTDCLKPYPDSDVRKLQEACQDSHSCLVQDKEGTGPCGINNEYVYSLVNYTCVDGSADEVSKEKSVLGKTVYVELAGRVDQQKDENTTCIAQSTSKDLRISFVTQNLPPGAQVVVKVGETTHDLSERNKTYSVTSPVITLTYIQGNARVTVWAIIDSKDSEVNVTCTSHSAPVPQGEGHLVGAVVGGLSAAVVGVAVLVLLAVYCFRSRMRTSRYARGTKTSGNRHGDTTGNLSSDGTRGNEYAVVEIQHPHVQNYELRGRPRCSEGSDGSDENYDRLGHFRQPPQNNNLGEPVIYGHIRPGPPAANGESDYDHVIRGPKPGVVTEIYS